MNAGTDLDVAGCQIKERLAGRRMRRRLDSHRQRRCTLIDTRHQLRHLIQATARLGGSATHLKRKQEPAEPTSLKVALPRCRCDVIGQEHRTGYDAQLFCPAHSQPGVEDIPCVVGHQEHNARPTVGFGNSRSDAHA